MAEFDARWKRLVDAAGPEFDPIAGAPPERIRALAALARRRPEPEPFTRVERRSLFALAALLLAVLASLVPWHQPVAEFLAVARADLAVLPSRIPRPPHPPPASRAFADVLSFLAPSTDSTESQP